MATEVEKLVMFARGRRIEEGDVRAVVSYAQEANVFAMIDAIIEFKAGVAQGLLQQLLKQGAIPAYLLVMLARQVQLIVRVKELRDQRKSRNEIQDKLGLTSSFVLRKAWEQADKYSMARLREVYHKLLECDLSIKTGKRDGELALNILIAELCQRGAVRA
jgi:DNA polymerase-3 subunit delta